MEAGRTNQKPNFSITQRVGITLLDVLVVLVVIVTIAILAAPALRNAQESARRQKCIDNLRQIGIGLAGFEKTHGHFPARNHTEELMGSWITGVIPHMGNEELHDQVMEAYRGSMVRVPEPEFRECCNRLRKITATGFHCPSDPAPLGRTTSYTGCSGTSPQFFVHDDGLFRWTDFMAKDLCPPDYQPGPVRTEDVTDGLSNTIAVSEWLRSWDVPGKGPEPIGRRRVWKFPVRVGAGAALETLVSICRQAPFQCDGDLQVNGWKGGSFLGQEWFAEGNTMTNYYQTMPPNTPSCEWAWLPNAITTASSVHDKGVNGLFADGHVRFISESVDVQLWRDFGSRSQERPADQF